MRLILPALPPPCHSHYYVRACEQRLVDFEPPGLEQPDVCGDTIAGLEPDEVARDEILCVDVGDITGT
jgi:hypothetical protein